MQGPLDSIQVRPLDDSTTNLLWTRIRTDEGRPLEFTNEAMFRNWIAQRASAELLGYGAIRCVLVGDDVGGVVTLSIVDAQFCPPLQSVVECGTYLLPEWRGSGIHPEVKQRTIDLAFGELAADWVCFVIPRDNPRAERAFAKLGWNFKETEVGCVGHFKRLTDRKTWELGRPCRVFWIRQGEIWSNTLGNA